MGTTCEYADIRGDAAQIDRRALGRLHRLHHLVIVARRLGQVLRAGDRMIDDVLEKTDHAQNVAPRRSGAASDRGAPEVYFADAFPRFEASPPIARSGVRPRTELPTDARHERVAQLPSRRFEERVVALLTDLEHRLELLARRLEFD